MVSNRRRTGLKLGLESAVGETTGGVVRARAGADATRSGCMPRYRMVSLGVGRNAAH